MESISSSVLGQNGPGCSSKKSLIMLVHVEIPGIF
jgi:hypothetical protein